MVVLLVMGTGVVVFALWVVVFRGGYAEAELPDSVEDAHLRRVAEARVSALCPGAIRLAERERAGGGAASEELASAREFWRRFAAVSVERDPVVALRELRGLPELLEEAIREADREAAMAKDVPRREDGR